MTWFGLFVALIMSIYLSRIRVMWPKTEQNTDPPPTRKFPASDAPPEVTKLIWQLVPQLIQGDHPALWALREQFRRARITEIEMDGVGFFAEFDVPEDAPLVDPPNMTGGSAVITVEGLEHGADCVLFVRGGRLSMFEGYSNAGEDWPDDAKVLAVSNVVSILSDQAPRSAGGIAILTPPDLQYFSTAELTGDHWWQLLDWCLAHGANEFTLKTAEPQPLHITDIYRTGRMPPYDRTAAHKTDAFLQLMAPHERPPALRWGHTEDQVAVVRLWTLCPETISILRNVQPEGLFDFLTGRDFWLEDPFIYRDGQFLVGVISHESEGFTCMTPPELTDLARMGINWTDDWSSLHPNLDFAKRGRFKPGTRNGEPER